MHINMPSKTAARVSDARTAARRAASLTKFEAEALAMLVFASQGL